ncbi:MAG TPA: hypothetical protein DCQ98_18895 [Planctomycetaceae bacterium]|nr:hypothetical protein [Planctomycetaceae bacterium]HRF00737.1 hypothetical protein [Pirellulaceae bacterium]
MSTPLLLGIALGLGLAVVAGSVILWAQRRRALRASDGGRNAQDETNELPIDLLPTIDLDRLESPAVPPFPRLELLGTRSRLAVLVLAPVGRGTPFPSREHWRDVVDQVVPGLSRVLDHHRPVFRRWPEQVSQHGFMHAFFHAMRSATDGSERSNWSRLAGRVEWRGSPILIGMVLRTDSPQRESTEVEHAGRWLDLLKVRSS